METKEMHTRSMFAVGCLAVVCSAGSAQIIQGPIVNPANGHTYYLLEQSSWSQAQLWAADLGGNLVTVRNQAENDWLYTTFGSPTGTPRHLWIGLNDAAQEGVFEWISGEPVSYFNWDVNEPNNFGNEDFVHIWADEDQFSTPGGRWNDYPDIDLLRGIGNYGVVEVIPAPAAFAMLGLAGLAGTRRRR
jgi:hypothetical protein